MAEGDRAEIAALSREVSALSAIVHEMRADQRHTHAELIAHVTDEGKTWEKVMQKLTEQERTQEERFDRLAQRVDRIYTGLNVARFLGGFALAGVVFYTHALDILKKAFAK